MFKNEKKIKELFYRKNFKEAFHADAWMTQYKAWIFSWVAI
jgi:hypothetical protein